MDRYKVLLYEDMHEAGKAILKEKAGILFASSLEETSLIEEVKEVDGIIIRANGKVTRTKIESALRFYRKSFDRRILVDFRSSSKVTGSRATR